MRSDLGYLLEATEIDPRNARYVKFRDLQD